MKYQIIKLIVVLVILVNITSCVTRRVHTNRRVPRRGAYHGAGDRFW